jgi:ABC-type polysaccharide/polyol phosphate transport system ATPase subunit
VARRLRLRSGDQQVGWAARELWALKEVSFGVQPGTVLGIIGANGAGKTTLLKVLGRVTPPTEGRAIVRGQVVSLLEIGAGFQPEFSGRENVFMYGALYGISRAEVARRLETIIEWAGLEKFIDTPVKRYSSGMYLRLAFSTAINMEPDILLADEVLAVGDLSFQERCIQRVEAAGKAGVTVLFVSHDMAAIKRLCNRVIWLDGGRVRADGGAEAVVKQYEESAWSSLGGRGRQSRGSHVTPFGEILSTRLHSAVGDEIGAARVADEVLIKTTVDIREPDVQVCCAFTVYARGSIAFRAIQPDDLQVREPGVFGVSIRVPAHLLADVQYTVQVDVLIVAGERFSKLVQDDAVTFRVYDDEAIWPQGTFRGRPPGVVKPRLAWQVVQERDLVSP